MNLRTNQIFLIFKMDIALYKFFNNEQEHLVFKHFLCFLNQVNNTNAIAEIELDQ